MKYIGKTIRPRLPRELAVKLRRASGGGRHQDKKADFKRRPKHRHKNSEGSDLANTNLFATFIKNLNRLNFCSGKFFKICHQFLF